ncbi:hypothetical protein GCM10022261_07110 [Brevibacterium daeguense]|uniref:Uncharacterized protein n=1 Tax=Brevibacterium daeguense TaxID=909936 RepID=A0ABP8EGW1_9MICO|nr:hypothetical protein [Brevibacterium daeguense]
MAHAKPADNSAAEHSDPDSTREIHAPESSESPRTPESPKSGEAPGTRDDSSTNLQENTESSGNPVLDKLNAAAEAVLGPPPRAEDLRGGYEEDLPPAREVAAAHGDRLFTTADGERIIIDMEDELPQHSDPDR